MRLVFNWTTCLRARLSERLVFGAFICGTLSALSSQAQTVTGPPLVLKPSTLLQETITGDVRKELPTYLQSDRMSGETNLEFFLEGQTVIRRGVSTCDAFHSRLQGRIDMRIVEDCFRMNTYIVIDNKF